MKDYLTDPDAMACPWIESPFFNELLDQVISTETTPELYFQENIEDTHKFLRTIALSMNENGYVILPKVFTNDFCDKVVNQLQKAIEEEAITKQAGHFHYNESPRIFEAWKTNKDIVEICTNIKIMNVLTFLYRKNPVPFQTINFKMGSTQPVHSDVSHFHTIPHRWVCGVWTALEDITNEAQGPLIYYPGSHKGPIIEFQDLNLEKTEYKEEKSNYTEYENYLKAYLQVNQFEEKKHFCDKGDVLIWSANLLHGGSQIPEGIEKKTRWSQATHYYFEGCRVYYTPFYSDPFMGIYAHKDLSNKDIREKRTW